MTQRIMPHDLEAEQTVIGSVLLDWPECWPLASAVLDPDAFFAPAHNAIWAAITACSGGGTGIDETMVRGELQRAGNLELVGELLTEVTNRVPDTRNIEAHAMTVRNLHIARGVVKAASAIVNRACGGEIGDLTEFLDHAEHAVAAVCEARPTTGQLEHIRDVVVGAFDEIVANADNKVEMVGVTTGFEDLDRFIQGVQAGLVYVLAGRPGMGKTGFGLNVMRNVAEAAEAPALFFSLEMTNRQLAMRMLSSESLVDGEKFRRNRITREDWPKLSTGAGTLCNLPIYFDDVSTDIDDICRVARKAYRESKNGLSIIALDYVQLCTARGKYNSRQEEVSYISRTLKKLAKELQVPILELAQVNRDLEKRKITERRPMIADLRESGALEQDADCILFLYRDELYRPETTDRGLCEVIIAKWRMGATGTIKTVFLKAFTRFENYDGAGPEPENFNDDPTQGRYQ